METKFKLKKEARQFFDVKYHKEIQTLKWWDSLKVHKNLLVRQKTLLPTHVWQKWRCSTPLDIYCYIQHSFSASAFVVKSPPSPSVETLPAILASSRLDNISFIINLNSIVPRFISSESQTVCYASVWS